MWPNPNQMQQQNADNKNKSNLSKNEPANTLIQLVGKHKLNAPQNNIFHKNLRKKNKKKNIMIISHPSGKMWPINAVPEPPHIVFQDEDFSKDLLDVGDSSNSLINAVSFNKFTMPSCNPTNTATSTSITAPKFTGQKIPVNMREDIIRKTPTERKGAPAGNKQAHVQSNQLLKDFLSSDIETVVKNNIKANVPQTQMESVAEGFTQQYTQFQNPNNKMMFVNAPRGVPKSFLTRPNQTVIEPQIPGFVDQQQQQHHFAAPRPARAVTSIDRTQSDPHAFSSATAQTPARYSPTDLYSDLAEDRGDGRQDGSEDSSAADAGRAAEKRVSAFERLGPLSAQPKTPKLTINLSFNKEQAVREVVDGSKGGPACAAHVPVHMREDILHSTDETVMKYVALWPWAQGVHARRTAASRACHFSGVAGDGSSAVGYSPTAMMMLKEQMDEWYQRDNIYFAITVAGYPESWTKEDVLDAMLENLKGKSFIPCFTEFTSTICMFIVIRCRSALLAIHALDFHIQKDDIQLSITISQLIVSLLQMDFIPRLIIRKRLGMLHSEGTKLNISGFTLEPDVSHFIYFPLNQLTNQLDLMDIQTDIIWCNLIELNLSHNRLTTIEGFDLERRTPRLRSLDLSHNRLESVAALPRGRRLPLRALRLEGNPLCGDHTDPDRYAAALRMLFPTLRALDDVPICLPGELPLFKRNYCPEGAACLIDNFLQLFFPLLDAQHEQRLLLANMYAEDAFITITYRPSSGRDGEVRYPRGLLLLSRALLEGARDYAAGREGAERLLRRWPALEHDPCTVGVDVMWHDETSTLFRMDGIVKLPADSLAENDQLIAFTRTILLQTANGVEYKIKNEMIYWDMPTAESADAAFRRTLVQRKPLSFKLVAPPDEEGKKKLILAFMKLTRLEESPSSRCLEEKDWDLRKALEYFIKLYKEDNLQPLMQPDQKPE